MRASMGNAHRTGGPARSLGDSAHAACGTLPGVSTARSDLAALSSMASQIGEISGRITELAERYGTTPDSAVAGELFTTERALTTALRSLDRAASLLDRAD